MTTGAALSLVDSFVALVDATAWPLVLLFLVLIFRRPLTDLLNRMEFAQWGDKSARFPRPQAAPTEKPGSTAPLSRTDQLTTTETNVAGRISPQSFIPADYRDVVAEASAHVSRTLPSLKERVTGNDEEILKEWLGETTVALALERASRTIFQSQLSALDALKDKANLTREDFRPFYEAVARSAPNLFNTNFPFEQWFNFFTLWGLVEIVGDTVKVSPLGRVLKRYMAERNYVPPPNL